MKHNTKTRIRRSSAGSVFVFAALMLITGTIGGLDARSTYLASLEGTAWFGVGAILIAWLVFATTSLAITYVFGTPKRKLLKLALVLIGAFLIAVASLTVIYETTRSCDSPVAVPCDNP